MVAATGIGLGGAGLLAAIGVPLGIERYKRPRLEIEPVKWRAARPTYPMTFASVQVTNRPISGLISSFLSRDVAEACEITIDFYTWGDEASRERVFDTIRGRWDSHVPEPFRATCRLQSSGRVATNGTARYTHDDGSPDNIHI
jgi:hypothetical protein